MIAYYVLQWAPVLSGIFSLLSALLLFYSPSGEGVGGIQQLDTLPRMKRTKLIDDGN